MPETAEDLRAAQVEEWGQYVATGPIDIGGVRAFNTGDPVPADHVKRGVVDKAQVAKTNTKAAQAATSEPAPAEPAKGA